MAKHLEPHQIEHPLTLDVITLLSIPPPFFYGKRIAGEPTLLRRSEY